MKMVDTTLFKKGKNLCCYQQVLCAFLHIYWPFLYFCRTKRNIPYFNTKKT